MKSFRAYTFILLTIILSYPLDIHGQLGSFFPSDKSKIKIPFEYKNNLILIDIQVNGAPPAKFIFDTGAQHILITDEDYIESLNLNFTRSFEIFGADQRIPLTANLATNIELTIGKLKAQYQHLLALEDAPFNLGEKVGEKIAGIFGAAFFKYQVFEINYKKKKIIIQKHADFKAPKNQPAYPIELIKNKPYLKTYFSYQPNQNIPVQLLFDSGSSIALLFDAFELEQREAPTNLIPGNFGFGLGGALKGFIGKIFSLQLPGRNWNNLPVNFVSYSETMLKNEKQDSIQTGIIGNPILKNYNITFDYLNARAFFKLKRKKPINIRYNLSGMQVLATGPQLNHYKAYIIYKEGPAYKAGIRNGDRLLKMNGRSAKYLDLDKVDKLLSKKVGKKIKLLIQRGEETIKVQFRLEKLL